MAVEPVSRILLAKEYMHMVLHKIHAKGIAFITEVEINDTNIYLGAYNNRIKVHSVGLTKAEPIQRSASALT